MKLSFKTFGLVLGLSSLYAQVQQWQNGDWKITRWGGTNSDIMRCDLDSQGNLWFGVLNGGLKWYDGTTVNQFSGDNLQFPHYFETVYVDEQDTVFWSHYFQTVKIYNKQQVGILPYSPKAFTKNPQGALYSSFSGTIHYLENDTSWVVDPTYQATTETGREMRFSSDSTLWLFNGGTYTAYYTPSFNSRYSAQGMDSEISNNFLITTGGTNGGAGLSIDTTVAEFFSTSDYNTNSQFFGQTTHIAYGTYPFETAWSGGSRFLGGLAKDANGLIWAGGINTIATLDLSTMTWEAWTGLDTLEAKISDIRIKGDKLIACATGTLYEYTGTKHLPPTSSSSDNGSSSSSDNTNPIMGAVMPPLLQIQNKSLTGVVNQSGLLQLKVYNKLGQLLMSKVEQVQEGQNIQISLPDQASGSNILKVGMENNGQYQNWATYHLLGY